MQHAQIGLATDTLSHYGESVRGTRQWNHFVILYKKASLKFWFVMWFLQLEVSRAVLLIMNIQFNMFHSYTFPLNKNWHFTRIGNDYPVHT